MDSGKITALKASLRPEGLLITALETGVLEIRDPLLILRTLSEVHGVSVTPEDPEPVLDQT